MAFPASRHDNQPYIEQVRFDTDSKKIGIYNRASLCISHDETDFEGIIKPTHDKIKGIGGDVNIYGIGTVVWDIIDEEGVKHKLRIPNSLYVKKSPTRLLSPQHWAQESKDHFPKKNGTWCATYDSYVVLHWNQNKFTKTVRLDKNTNVATMSSAPGFKKYRAFTAVIDANRSLPKKEYINKNYICNDASIKINSIINRFMHQGGRIKMTTKSKMKMKSNNPISKFWI